jgi:CubicO group peptidase (beta-lactamase class C family)
MTRPGRAGRVGYVTTALEDLLGRHIETGTIQGAVALLGRGDDVEVVPVGVASDDGRPMLADALMRIQSMTKVITSVAALRLVESGRLGLDHTVEEWLPELANPRLVITPTAALEDTVPARRAITLRRHRQSHRNSAR